jgi:membrane fusion protein (multidrug efflux system)
MDELRHQPIRPGLSTVTSINIKEPGKSAWTSLATASGQDYETNVFEDEFSTAQVMSEEIILKNLVWDAEHPAAEPGRPVKPIKARDDTLPISTVKTNANAS